MFAGNRSKKCDRQREMFVKMNAKISTKKTSMFAGNKRKNTW